MKTPISQKLRSRSLVLTLAVLALVLVVAALGYLFVPRRVPVSQFRPPYRVEVRSGRHRGTVHSLAPNSPEERAVTRWLQENAFGWRPTFVAYVPTRLIEGDGFTLNFLKGTCVLNYRASPNGDRYQVSRAIESDDAIVDVFSRAD